MFRLTALLLALALALLPHPRQAFAGSPDGLPPGEICGSASTGEDAGGGLPLRNHACPDCLPSAPAALVPGPAAALPFRPAVRRMPRLRPGRRPTGRDGRAPRARGPPGRV